jgi:hypothetical protein
MSASVLGTADKLHDTSHEDRVPLNDDFEMSSEAGAGASVVEKGCAREVSAHEVPNLTLWEAVQSINFWYLQVYGTQSIWTACFLSVT